MDSKQTAATERRQLALEKIDNAKFSWYHVRYSLLIFQMLIALELSWLPASDCNIPFYC